MRDLHGLLDRCSILLLPLASFLVFAPSLGTFFAQDDFSLLARAQTATPAFLWDNFALFGGGIYRPLREIYFAALFAAFGLNPYAFHLVGLILLVGSSALLGLLAQKLGIGRRGSLLAAVFYGSHSALLWLVMWSAAAGSLLAVFWSLWSLLLLYEQKNKWLGVLGLGCFALALTAREVAVVVPFVLLFASLLPAGPQSHRTVGLGKDRLVWSGLMLLLAGSYLIVRWNGTAQLAGSSPYRLDVGFNVPSNIAKLAIYASGVTVGGLPVALVAGFGVLFWLLVALLLLRSREGKLLGLFGLAWFVLGTVPVVFFSTHAMDAYYLDFALLGLAITVGSCYQTIERWLNRVFRPVYVPYVLVCCLVALNAVSVGLGQGRSAVALQAERAQRLLADVRAARPSLPAGATLVFENLDEVTVWAMAFGELYRVGYGDPSLRIFFGTARAEENERLFRFRMAGQHLVEAKALAPE